ncbi:MAG: hypothetical protein WC100_20230 [Sterolibacterium sp.]
MTTSTKRPDGGGLKRNQVLSFDDGLLTIRISGHGEGNGWGSIAFHERQIEIDPDGFHTAEIPPSELRALRDFLNRVLPNTPTNESPAPQADEDETGAWADLRASGGIFPEAYAVAQSENVMTEDQIKHMVNRFLMWKLPRDTFNPDCGISFDKKPYNTHTAHPSQHEPSGTNLFDATQADAMVRYMIDGLPTAPQSAPVFKASHNSGERDPSVTLGCTGADTAAPQPPVEGLREWFNSFRGDHGKTEWDQLLSILASPSLTAVPVGYISPETLAELTNNANGVGPVVASAAYSTIIPLYAAPATLTEQPSEAPPSVRDVREAIIRECASIAADHTPKKFEGTLAAHATGRAIECAILALLSAQPAKGER